MLDVTEVKRVFCKFMKVKTVINATDICMIKIRLFTHIDDFLLLFVVKS